MPERYQSCQENDGERGGAADFPKVALVLHRTHNIFQVHTIVAGEERQREENDSDDCEDHNGFTLRFRDDCKLILFDGAELKELNVSVQLDPKH